MDIQLKQEDLTSSDALLAELEREVAVLEAPLSGGKLTPVHFFEKQKNSFLCFR
jgi:hypothetical protein